ncbi:MAG: NifU N-terminal domain-containing protein [Candidatus Pacebacteria bacterium]|nr:NifU N-terminal domain-containing protein [Candidatus Paceibacterota bacterium]
MLKNKAFLSVGDVKVIMEKYPNPDLRGFHTSKRVLPMDESIIFFDCTDEKYPLITSLLEIEGVTEGTLEPYKILVSITPTKSWEEILPKVKKELTNYFKE